MNKALNNIEPSKLAIIMFGSGLGIGIVIMTFGLLIQNSYLKSNGEGQLGTVDNSKIIESKDLFPEIETINSFTAEIKEKKSDKELIVRINNKNIKVILDENTKIIKQEMKTEEQQKIDMDNYDRIIRENPNQDITPELPFIETEISLESINLEQEIEVITEENIIAKSEVKASKIIIIN